MDQDSEAWAAVKGYEGLYEISNLGAVRRLDRVTTGGGDCGLSSRRLKARNLKPGLQSRGYLTVVLCKGSAKQTVLVHRLVAESFLPNPLDLPNVNHIDGCQTNNESENLEWCTQLHNVQHAIAMGRSPNIKGAANV